MSTKLDEESALNAWLELARRRSAKGEHLDVFAGRDLDAHGVRIHVARNQAERTHFAATEQVNDMLISAVSDANLGPEVDTCALL
jgi:hypothetical protein